MKIKPGRGLFCSLLLFCFFGLSVTAQAPYENYTYSFDEQPQAEPQVYLPSAAVTGNSINAGDFNNPQDIFAADDGKIYIADTGNNRILTLTADWKIERIIKAFGAGNEDGFLNPHGIFVTSGGDLYVADTDHSRIVVFDKDGVLKTVYNTPDSKMMTTVFQPLKVAVDLYGRIYVVSRGCEKGFIQLERDGSFLSYYGAIKTTLSPGEAVWRLFMTEAQKKRTIANIPTVYSNCDVDREGFVFGTVSAAGTVYNSSIVIRKLNPLGTDILKREGFSDPMGDLQTSDDKTTHQPVHSKFTDICALKNGAYSALDMEKKKIFTYDNMGNLLYVFGAEGSQLGSFKNPTGIAVTPGGDFLVIDGQYNHIVVFKPTEYALLLNEAMDFQHRRRYSEAEAKWNEVLKYSSKSEVVYNSLGKIMLAQEKYKDALFYFKLGSYRDYYSVAFGYYRKLLLNKYFYLLFAGLAVTAGIILLRLILKRKRKRSAL